MEIKSGIKYYIKAIAKQMIIFSRGKYYNLGDVVEGNLDGKTLKLVEYALDIQEIHEIRVAPTIEKPKEVIKEPSENVSSKSKSKKTKEE